MSPMAYQTQGIKGQPKAYQTKGIKVNQWHIKPKGSMSTNGIPNSRDQRSTKGISNQRDQGQPTANQTQGVNANIQKISSIRQIDSPHAYGGVSYSPIIIGGIV